MKNFEQRLQSKIDKEREEQWKVCQEYLRLYKEGDVICKRYNIHPCPMRCDYAQSRIKPKHATPSRLEKAWSKL